MDDFDTSAGTRQTLVEEFDNSFKPLMEKLAKVRKQLISSSCQLDRSFKEASIQTFMRQQFQLEEQIRVLTEIVAEMKVASEALAAENTAAEEYAKAFESACRSQKLPLQGHYPVYEVFPFEVRFYLEERYVRVNGKTVYTLRPDVLAAYIRKTYDRLHNTSFNARRFRQALLSAYDLLTAGKELHQPVPLRQVYELLCLRDGTKAYPMQAFAFDIYRLRRDSLTEGNRRLVFIPGRSARSIVVPTGHGETENLSALQVQEVV